MADRSPLEPRSERARGSAETAFIWLGCTALLLLAWQVAEALLLIFAGLVFAAGLQGGERALARVLPVPRGVRLAIVIILVIGGTIGFLGFAGVTLANQAQQLSQTLSVQIAQLAELAREYGLSTPGGDALAALKSQLGGQLGRITAFVGSAVTIAGTVVIVVTLGIYVAADPQLYERGIEWLAPATARPGLRKTLDVMARTLRRWVAGRLLTMSIEGSLILVGLLVVGVPLAGLLALVAGLLAFIPTIGSMISGVLIVAVAFSAGATKGLWAIGIFLAVQQLEGNILTPQIEKRAVDLAPAVVLGAQLLFGVLFGILGVALADPITALIKVGLKERDDGKSGSAA